MLRTSAFRLLAGTTLFLSTQVAFAQAVTVSQVDSTQLMRLYESWLQDPTNEWVNQRIADERNKIRDQLESETAASIGASVDIDQVAETELVKSVERQRNIVDALEERLRERKVDLDLLILEEKNVYKATGTGMVQQDQFRTTTSYADLLTKKAILEERISVLQSVLPLQLDRLSRLVYRQRISQFGTVIYIGFYLLIVLAIVLIESAVRHMLLSRIKNDNKRYMISKAFTALVYSALLLGTIAVIFAENPSLVTSLAIVGAGLAVALQDVVKDLIAWVVIVQRSIFSLGDRISIGRNTGEVIDIGILRFTLQEVGHEKVLEHTGKTVSLPNSLVLREPVVNHSRTSDYEKAEIRLVITFESDRRKAEEIFTHILQEETEEFAKNELRQHIQNTRRYYLSRQPIGMKIFKNIVGSGFEFTMRFSVPIGMQRTVTSVITSKMLDAIDAEPTVELAYDTYRIVK